MKKFLAFFLILTLLSGFEIVTAAQNEGPITHTLPAVIDFNDEVVGKYYQQYLTPKTFFNISSYNYIEEKGADRYLSMKPTAAVSSKNLIMFEDFKYDSTATGGVQPTKLVISFEAQYEKLTNSESSLMSADYVHIGIADTTDVKYGTSATHSQMLFKLYYNGMTDGNIGDLGYMSGGSGHGFVATALENHAYREKINSGEKVNYTFIVDLTRNSNGKPTTRFYIDSVPSPDIPFEGESIDSINSVIFGATKSCVVNIDNVRIFEVPNEKIEFVSADVSGTGVSNSERNIRLNFSHEVTMDANKYISVFKDGKMLTLGTDYSIEPAYNQGEKTAKAISVNFTGALDTETTYTIKSSAGYFGADGTAIGEELTLTTFTTESDPVNSFDVIQSTGLRGVYGVSGTAMLAQFDGAPGKIYVSRELREDAKLTDGYPSYLTSCIAKVIDPNGNTAGVYDFAHMSEKGKEYHVFNLTDNIPGIWTIQIMNGRGKDIFTIGVNDTDIWGIRGEKVLGSSATLPKESWIYVQDDYDYCYIATSSAKPFEIYDGRGNKVIESEVADRVYIKEGQKVKTSDLTAGATYKVKWGEGASGNIEVDGIPGLFCPSKEAAEILKGGWMKSGNVTVHGIIQKNAREEIIRLIDTKNLDYTYDKPAKMPTNLKNPMAEAQLFGGYGILGGIGSAVKNQVLDKNSPYLGLASVDPITVPEKNWQQGHYVELTSFAQAANAMAAVSTSLDLELNYLKGSDALIQRAAIGLLGIITQLSEDHGFRVNNLSGGSYVLMTGAMFTFEPMSTAYEFIRPYVDDRTREVLDEGMAAVCDKMCNYVGQGPTNQALFCMSMSAKMYSATGVERYHDTFKRQITSLIENTNNQHGQAKLGYFIEATGCDSSYEYMNRYHYYSIYKYYKNLPYADKTLIERMKNSIQKSLEFESFFWAPQPYDSKVESINPNNFTTRTNSGGVGTDNYPGYSIIWDEFPLARRRRDMVSGYKLASTASMGYPHRINNEDWAYKQIKKYWGTYENEFTAKGYGVSDWTLGSYNAFNATEWAEPAENLPFEAADGTFWQQDGLFAFKHKGIYGLVFFGIDNSPNWSDNYSLMGGGPTFLWGEDTGKTLVSKKSVGYQGNKKVESAQDITTSCVYGTDSSGNLTFYSGKEGTTYFGGIKNLTYGWVSYGKTFSISGDIPDANATTASGEKVMTGKNVTWTYGFNNNGLSITTVLTGMKSGETCWLNLPIATEDKNIVIEYKPGSLVVKNGNGSMTYTWDSNFSSLLSEEVNGVRNLKLKMPLNGKLTINVSAQSPKFTITEMALYEDIQIGDRRLTETLKSNGKTQYISFRIRNNTVEAKKAKLIIVHYDEKGKFTGIISEKQFDLKADATQRIVSDALPLTDKKGTVRAFIWTDDNNIQPLTEHNEWQIK